MEDAYPTLSLHERDRRWKAIRELMIAEGIDCLIVAGLRGREQLDGYLTNDCVEGILVFPRKGDSSYLALATSRITRNLENLKRGGTSWVDDWKVGATGPGLVNTLKEKGFESSSIGVIGLNSHAPGEIEGYISYRTWRYVLDNLPKAHFIDYSRQYAEVMIVKSDEELALVRHSARIGEIACEAMLKASRAGVRESEVFSAVMSVIYAHGAGSRWPILNLHTGQDNLSWGPSMWLYQAQPPHIIQKGDVVQAEIFPCYGGLESQQQMSVALTPVHLENQRCAEVARQSYEIGLHELRPGRSFREVASAMEAPLLEAGFWRLTPLIHSLNPIWWGGPDKIDVDHLISVVPEMKRYLWRQQIKRPPMGEDLIIKPGMVFELEPNACCGRHRINIGGTVIVTEEGVEELNRLAAVMQIVDG